MMGIPMVAVVGYFQVPTRLNEKAQRYKNENERNAPLPDETKETVRGREGKVSLTKMEEPDGEKPWETYGVSKTRFREIQRKNDVNINKIHEIIKNTSKKGPQAWRD
eukprot:CAMPEP_0184486782 /NCGR_PEP_ID=MMETSP0113_2-20130426/8618_1 /TAXON_ID=91329 /ORGANISM="Norrisiella sphaerica, Strain BC52" /LENGTH=106 /DNA_ID=CAMNT_0026868825 /DNA_START=221 /DNA_END=541 /DNA_ORIENTATION=+